VVFLGESSNQDSATSFKNLDIFVNTLLQRTIYITHMPISYTTPDATRLFGDVSLERVTAMLLDSESLSAQRSPTTFMHLLSVLHCDSFH
jgi:hypothetical protein